MPSQFLACPSFLVREFEHRRLFIRRQARDHGVRRPRQIRATILRGNAARNRFVALQQICRDHPFTSLGKRFAKMSVACNQEISNPPGTRLLDPDGKLQRADPFLNLRLSLNLYLARSHREWTKLHLGLRVGGQRCWGIIHGKGCTPRRKRVEIRYR